MDLKERPIYMEANAWYKAKQGDVITYIYPTGCQEFYEIRINIKSHTINLDKKVLSKDIEADYFDGFVRTDMYRASMDLQDALNDYIREIPLKLTIF